MRRCSTLIRSSCPSVLAFTRNVTAAPAASLVPRAAAAAAVPALPLRRGFSDDTRSPFVPKPVYSSYKVYKTKTALDVSVVRAQLGWNSARVEERKYLSLKRAGGFRFTFAAGENRSYDWEQGQLITLNVAELGDVIAFGQNKDQAELKFTHDPNFGSEVAGLVRKELIMKRIGGGKPGYFLNFAVINKDDTTGAGERKWSIAVTEGEFQVLLTIIQQTLPDLLALSTKPQIQRAEDEYQGGAGSQARNNKWDDSK